MKKSFELISVFPFSSFTKGRYVEIRNIWTGYTETNFYPIQNKRKLIDQLRKKDIMCPHYVYRNN